MEIQTFSIKKKKTNKIVELKRQVPKGLISDESKTSGEKLFFNFGIYDVTRKPTIQFLAICFDFTENEKLSGGLETRSSCIGALFHEREIGVCLIRNALRLQLGTWLGLDSSHVPKLGNEKCNFRKGFVSRGKI